MVHAELHGKLGTDGCGANERMEDVLTSNVFGLLRYLPAHRGILRWFGAALPIGRGDPLRSVTDPELHFWPRLGRGEVDLLCALPLSAAEIDLVAIECKYRSTKSGRARDGALGEEAARDQLAKYACALAAGDFDTASIVAGRRVRRSVVLYVTADAAVPQNEIEETLGALGDPCWRDRLFWLGWDCLWEVLRPLAAEPDLTGAVARDLRELLAHKRLRPFTGFGALHATLVRSSCPTWRVYWRGLSGAVPSVPSALWRARWSDLVPLPTTVARPLFRSIP